MKKGDDTRAKLLDTAGTLLQEQGYRGASLQRILSDSGAPRGSLYFHFPGGKEQLVSEALTLAADRWKALLEDVLDTAPDMAAGIATVCATLAEGLTSSGFYRGCPLATATLEAAADSHAIQQVSEAHYRAWEETIAHRLERHGAGGSEAEGFARLALSAIEGALLLARAYRDPAPLHDVGKQLIAALPGSVRD